MLQLQSIFHYPNVDKGLVDIAKEERVDHFIETYYRAAAEIFSSSYTVKGTPRDTKNNE